MSRVLCTSINRFRLILPARPVMLSSKARGLLDKAPRSLEAPSTSSSSTEKCVSTGPSRSSVSLEASSQGGTKAKLSVPLHLLAECEGRPLTVETRHQNELVVYRGRLVGFDKDVQNLRLENVVATREKDSSRMHLQSVYLRGDKVRFILLPQELEQGLDKMVEEVSLQGMTTGTRGQRGRGRRERGQKRTRGRE